VDFVVIISFLSSLSFDSFLGCWMIYIFNLYDLDV
jgi:hypothetical protein